jgi:beta-lactamase regulating signal transducer with metallopeptidase domain
MEPLLRGASALSAVAVSSLIAAVWEGVVLALGVALCIRFLPRLSAASRSVIWLNVFLLLVLLHVLPSFRGPVGIAQSAHASPILLRPGYGLLIAALWVVLSLWRGAQLVLSAHRLHQLFRCATAIHPDEAIRAVLQGNGGRSAELCTSLEVERPSVIGFLRPRILLPPALLQKLSAQELQQVVLHEMEHLRRGDDWTNLLQKIGLMLFPLNPVLFWAERRLCAERELACDDRVLQSSCTRKAYAMCLTRLAEDSVIRRKLSLALGAWDRRSELVSRVHRLLVRPGQSMGGRQAALVIGCLMVGIFGGALALARSPQLVGFATYHPSMSQVSGLTETSFHGAGLHGANSAEAGGSLQLVKAVMPETPARPTLKPQPPRRHAARQATRPRIAQNRQAWLVLTDWNDSMPPPHLVIAVAPGDPNTYAAVPIAHGWLILQI